MIISGRYFAGSALVRSAVEATYSELNSGPSRCQRVEHKYFGVAVLALETAVYKHVLLAGHECFVVRDLARNAALRVH